eukprot:TRINITY_DN72139_c0_g1_i1.p1 TRINITY_DN72139_c0_g1~~TRINITY_DN72139_c0_g1_i1.p1  ORF type:complete len:366 (-),score=78.28 TRINITY_DN72139_c0_g1_i1:268-1365(-)
MAGATQHDLSGREAEVIREVVDTLRQLVSLHQDRSGCKTCFDSGSVPPIGLKDYVERLWKYMDCSIQCFVFGIAYIRRIIHDHPDIRVSDLNVHTLAFSSLVIAAKFHDDTFRTNPYYARVGGVSTGGLYNLECSLLKLLNWRAGVTLEEFGWCCDFLFREDGFEILKSRHQAPQDLESFVHGRQCTVMQACPVAAAASPAESPPTDPLAASREANEEDNKEEDDDDDDKLTEPEGEESPTTSPNTTAVKTTASVNFDGEPKLPRQPPVSFAASCPVVFSGQFGVGSAGGRRGGGSARNTRTLRSRGGWVGTAVASLPWLSTIRCWSAEAALGFMPGQGQLSTSLLARALSLFEEVQPCSQKLGI